jgi:putative phage-type endonuclease
MEQNFCKTNPSHFAAAHLEQRSDDWHAARLGCVTASRVADIVAKTKSGYAASRQNYMGQLLSERLTGLPTETFQNAAMRWGTEMEDFGVEAYAHATGLETFEVGFLFHPNLGYAGASPDRLVAPDGLVEIKCPTTVTHIETLLKGEVPERYMIQMQWQMACTDRAWCDFVSFDPRVPEEYQLFIQRVERNSEQIAELEAEVACFLNEIEAKLDALEDLPSRYGRELCHGARGKPHFIENQQLQSAP